MSKFSTEQIKKAHTMLDSMKHYEAGETVNHVLTKEDLDVFEIAAECLRLYIKEIL